MKKSNRLIPELQIVDELPQWIISSDIAAYQPWTRTIWIQRRSLLRMLWCLVHEAGHHIIEVFGGGRKAQEAYDRYCG